MADDIISCTRYLLQQHHQQKAILIGYSIGASTALMAAVKESNLFSQLFLVGIDIDLPKANDYAFNFLAAKAKESGNAKQMRQAKELSQAPILETIAFPEMYSNENCRQKDHKTSKTIFNRYWCV